MQMMPEKVKKPPRRFIKRRYLVLLVLLFAAGYGLFANAHRISVEAQRLWLHYQLETARQKWEANKPTAYRFEFTHKSQGIGGFDDRLRITYVEGLPIQAEVFRTRRTTLLRTPDIDDVIDTISSLMDAFIQFNHITDGTSYLSLPILVTLEFDEKYGYPTYFIACETDVTMPDECLLSYTITNFEIAENVIPFADTSNP